MLAELFSQASLPGEVPAGAWECHPKQMAWRGLGTKEIDTNAKPDKRDKSIKKAVDKIFKNYPPKKKS